MEQRSWITHCNQSFLKVSLNFSVLSMKSSSSHFGFQNEEETLTVSSLFLNTSDTKCVNFPPTMTNQFSNSLDTKWTFYNSVLTLTTWS